MPFPALPAGARYRPGVYTVHERPVYLFTKRIGPDRSKFYVDKETRREWRAGDSSCFVSGRGFLPLSSAL